MSEPTAATSQDQSGVLWRHLIWLPVVVTLAYLPAASNDFVYDDVNLILKQKSPSSLADTLFVFRERHWGNLPYYRPVARWTMVVQKYLHGDQAGPYHVFNALLMGIAALLAYAVLRLPAWGIPKLLAMLMAGLFALHPVASSTVYPICSGRETLLPATFVLATVCCFFQRGMQYYVLSLIAFALALLSKEQAVVVPLLLGLGDALKLTAEPPGRQLGRWVQRYAPIVVIMCAYFGIRQILFTRPESFGGLQLWEAPWGVMVSLGYAIQTTVAPFIELRYEPALASWFSVVRLVIAALVVLAIGVVAVRHSKVELRALVFWPGWIGLSLLPTANILHQEAMFAERYLLLSLVGWLAVGAMALGKAWQTPFARPKLVGGLSVALAVCALISVQRAQYFRNDRVFLKHWSVTNPESAMVHVYLGRNYANRQEIEEAERCFERAIELDPEYDAAYSWLGQSLVMRGELQLGLRHCLRSIELDATDASNHNNAAVAYAKLGEFGKATEHFLEAIRLAPSHPDAPYNLGGLYRDRGDPINAIKYYKRAIEVGPQFVLAHNALGEVYEFIGDRNSATQHYETAVRIEPTFEPAIRNLQRLRGANVRRQRP